MCFLHQAYKTTVIIHSTSIPIKSNLNVFSSDRYESFIFSSQSFDQFTENFVQIFVDLSI